MKRIKIRNLLKSGAAELCVVMLVIWMALDPSDFAKMSKLLQAMSASTVTRIMLFNGLLCLIVRFLEFKIDISSNAFQMFMEAE